MRLMCLILLFFFQAEDGIRDPLVTGVQTCALPIFTHRFRAGSPRRSLRVSRLGCSTAPSRLRLQVWPSIQGTSKWVRMKKDRVGVEALAIAAKGVSAFRGSEVIGIGSP